MAIFQVTPLSNNFNEIKEALESKKGSEAEIDFFELQNSAGFLISDSGTTEEVSIKMGLISPDTNERPLGSGLVVRVSGYYGIGQTLMWEWLKSRMEKS
jgi:hypothetical protein